MKTKEYSFIVDGINYIVPVTYKHQNGVYLRANSKGFAASAPILLSEKRVIDFISSALPKLIKRVNKRQFSEKLSCDEYTYILGEKVDGKIDEKQLKQFALETFTNLTRECEYEMGVKKPYKIHVRNMKTRYGSNSMKTHSINYQLSLIHFSKDIIRSVVVHELAHDFFRNHQDKFYKCVLKYCPNYWDLKKKLRKGITK